MDNRSNGLTRRGKAADSGPARTYNRRTTEHSRVSRLPTALLVAWIAVMGASAPALACAAQVQGDCCPTSLSDPCSDHGSKPVSTGSFVVCCPAAPSNPASVSSLQARADLAKTTAPADPELDPILAFINTADLRPGEFSVASRPSRSPTPDGRTTYLHTGRLRL